MRIVVSIMMLGLWATGCDGSAGPGPTSAAGASPV